VTKFKQLGLVLKLSEDTAEVQIGPLRATVAKTELSKVDASATEHRRGVSSVIKVAAEWRSMLLRMSP